MRINWTVDHPEAQYSSSTGIDEEGNIYHENACREVVTVRMPDGRRGMGWTAEEALASAKAQPLDTPCATAPNKECT